MPCGNHYVQHDQPADLRGMHHGERGETCACCDPAVVFRATGRGLPPHHGRVAGCLRKWPYISSSANGTHLYSMSWALGSRRR